MPGAGGNELVGGQVGIGGLRDAVRATRCRHMVAVSRVITSSRVRRAVVAVRKSTKATGYIDR